MRQQINHLFSGTENQIINREKGYTLRVGTKHEEVDKVYEIVKEQNPITLTIIFMGYALDLSAEWSKSGKSCSYFGELPEKLAHQLFKVPKKAKPYIQIDNANEIRVHNGGIYHINVCPSLIKII